MEGQLSCARYIRGGISRDEAITDYEEFCKKADGALISATSTQDNVFNQANGGYQSELTIAYNKDGVGCDNPQAGLAQQKIDEVRS